MHLLCHGESIEVLWYVNGGASGMLEKCEGHHNSSNLEKGNTRVSVRRYRLLVI